MQKLGVLSCGRKLLLLANTLRDLRMSQLVARVWLRAKAVFRRVFHIRVKTRSLANSEPVPLIFEAVPLRREDYKQRADSARLNRFSFLRRIVQFGTLIDWRCSTESLLWQFSLNYCAVTLDFAYAYLATGDRIYVESLQAHIEAWLQANTLLTGAPWHPYTASVRVTNWIVSCSMVWQHLTNRFRQRFLESVLAHLEFISRNLEYDVLGNHLIANAKALIVGGGFLGIGELGVGHGFFRTGERMLMQQLSEQVLCDGGHCERSPMYHALVLEDLLLVGETYRYLNVDVPDQLHSCIAHMSQFLEGITMPGNNLPLLNDSVRGVSLDPETLIRWACTFGNVPVSRDSRNHALACIRPCYARAESAAGDVLIFDCGEVGPRYQPGHCHADTFSLVLTMADGTEFVVDPGVNEYASGPWRSYFRGTAAHNTVQVDGLDSTEVWGSFRAGRKAQVRSVKCRRSHEFCYFCGVHDGYQRLPGSPLHRRDVYFYRDCTLIVFDALLGSGQHLIDSRLHFHPDCEVRPHGQNGYVIDRAGHRMNLRFLGDGRLSHDRGSLEPMAGWYASEFGELVPCSCISWCNTVTLPYKFGFILEPLGESS